MYHLGGRCAKSRKRNCGMEPLFFKDLEGIKYEIVHTPLPSG